MPGAFKLDNLLTYKPHLVQICTNFCFPLCWGAQSHNPVIGPILRNGNSPNSDKIASDKLISTTLKFDETKVLKWLGQPYEAVQCPFSQFLPLSKFQHWISLEKENLQNSHSNLILVWIWKILYGYQQFLNTPFEILFKSYSWYIFFFSKQLQDSKWACPNLSICSFFNYNFVSLHIQISLKSE